MNPEKGRRFVSRRCSKGVGHILAEAISEMAAVRDAVRRVVWKTGKIVTTKAEIPEGQGLEYRDYFNYSEPIAQIPPHRVLAINRGDKEGPAQGPARCAAARARGRLFGQLPLEGHPHAELFRAAAIDSPRPAGPPEHGARGPPRPDRGGRESTPSRCSPGTCAACSCSRRSPSRSCWRSTPGSGPAARSPCSTAAATLLEHGVIYPHPPQNRRSEAKVFLKDLVGQAPGRRGRHRQRHGLPRDRGAGRRDHRRGNAVQPERGGCTPEVGAGELLAARHRPEQRRPRLEPIALRSVRASPAGAAS